MAAKPLKIVRTVKDLRKVVAGWRQSDERIALVPTMGALHEGHLALVGLARKKADRVVATIFVNPTQFAATEDLSRYPRDETGDAKMLGAAGVDLLFAPSVATMYPDGFASRIEPSGAALGLEGDARPHHFGGVATVCAKLFNQVQPDIGVFGEKDYQQLCVIRQLVRDLDLPVTIIGLSTVREKDGLALSSRNRYLSAAERKIAPALHRELKSIAEALATKPTANANALCQQGAKRLIAGGFASVDYIAVRDAETLSTDLEPDRRLRVLGAARLGKTRLIDNVAVKIATRIA